MKIKIRTEQNQGGGGRRRFRSVSPYQGRIGAWGVVQTVHTADNSVDVFIDGILVNHIPVASREWFVTPAEGVEYVSGSRNLPPLNARVFVLMPTGSFEGAFVLCSGLGIYDETHREAFTSGDHDDDADDEENTGLIRTTVLPGNWNIHYRYYDGGIEFVSPDEQTSFLLDYIPENPEVHTQIFGQVFLDIIEGDTLECTVFDTTLTIKEDGTVAIQTSNTVTIQTDKQLDIESGADVQVKAQGDATVEATNVMVKAKSDATVEATNVIVKAQAKADITAAQAEITGGILKVAGVAAPATGPFCAIPNCLFTGAPHGGNTVTGT
ncbi:hypothetical protein PilKf_01836 [Pillotina sp. SPG140]|jgi:hypothetical protein